IHPHPQGRFIALRRGSQHYVAPVVIGLLGVSIRVTHADNCIDRRRVLTRIVIKDAVMELSRGGDLTAYLTSDEVAQMLRVPYRSLMRWVEEGLVQPFRVGKRVRAPRLWNEKHIREARVIRTLRNEGVSMQAVKAAMDHLRSWGHNPFSTGTFLALDRGA